jgi:penicillin-binding protein 2
VKIKFGQQINKEFKKQSLKSSDILNVQTTSVQIDDGKVISYKYLLIFPIFISIFFIVVYTLISLQIFSHAYYKEKSQNNQFEIAEVKPNRGLIVDRNGKKLALNIPAVSVFVDTSEIINNDYTVNQEKLKNVASKIEEVLGKDIKEKGKIVERVNKVWEKYSLEDKGWVKKVGVLSGMSNDVAVKVRSAQSYLKGVTIENGSKRSYPYGLSMAHILGYTGNVYFEDLQNIEYVSFNDVIGKSGLELKYDEQLFGTKGRISRERDSFGNIVNQLDSEIVPSVSGATLNLSIDINAQEVMYEALKKGVKRFGADGGAAILQDIQTGEIISMASYPSYNNNLFVGGISTGEYNKVLKSGKNPLLNRAIAAQVPPGSTFKTIVASSALDAKAIDVNTIYTSRRGYTFSDDRPFPEYGNNSYGPLNVVSALTVSSNIFFCETIRNWDMDKLVPYLSKFGIGSVTGIDLDGEGAGRLPSPENKIKLAQTTSPWLDDVWYPEGDSCNSVIGQGITTVTPIQMVNWVSAIANGGTLNTPHLGTILEYPDGRIVNLAPKPIRKKIVGEEALKIVREGMWSSVNGARRVIIPLSGAKPEIAAKTGTAEFGRVDSNGRYENTHAWVTGFFPYDKPKYAFVVFLEDGGASNNSALIAREFIDWWNVHRK